MQEWLTFGNIKDTALFVLAVYGAALSTFNWRQAIQKDRRVVEVSLSRAHPIFQNGQIGSNYIKIYAVNIGHRSVTVDTLALQLSDGSRLVTVVKDDFGEMVDTKLPVKLADGESARVVGSYHRVAEALLKKGISGETTITPICLDSVGGVHQGKPWKVKPEEWINM